MEQTLHYIESNNDQDSTLTSLRFPAPENALSDPNGLLAVGGDLSPKRLITAYSQGIFPWFSEGDPIMWWSPDPRAVIPISDIIINRTLKKILNRKNYRVTLNNAFDRVIAYCADAPFRNEETWILDGMQSAYQKLHQQGVAHSIEVWFDDDELVGGLYGVAINGFFSGESMFYTQSNASKIALVYLAQLLKNVGIKFIDCQLTNPFLESMGSIEISRHSFIENQQTAMNIKLPGDFWIKRDLT